jgi:multidrug transporter EmrE-like cation transporter
MTIILKVRSSAFFILLWGGAAVIAAAQAGAALTTQFLSDSVAPIRILCIVLILARVIGLKLVSGD